MKFLTTLLAPLGGLGEAVLAASAARTEALRIEADLEARLGQLSVDRERVGADLQIELRRLDHARETLADALGLVRVALEHRHAERIQVLVTINAIATALTDGLVAGADQEAALETQRMLGSFMVDGGGQMVAELESAIRVTCAAIAAARLDESPVLAVGVGSCG